MGEQTMTKKKAANDGRPAPEVHEIGAACYSLRPEWGRHVPALICSCHRSFYGETWEEAGAKYDRHLREVGPGVP